MREGFEIDVAPVKEAGFEVTRCRCAVRQVHCEASLGQVCRLFAGQQGCSILGGNDGDSEGNRWSYFACEPVEVYERKADDEDILNSLAEVLGKYSLIEVEDNIPAGMFAGGWIGFFSYDLGRSIESVPVKAADDLKVPAARLCFYDRVLCYDRLGGKWYAAALEFEGKKQSADSKIEQLANLLHQAEGVNLVEFSCLDIEAVDMSKVRSNMERAYYFDVMKMIKEDIYNGEYYQINFSQRFEMDFNGCGIELYRWQNSHNPSPYACYIDAGDYEIVSASPELFLRVRDGRIATRPIKGTRPRVGESIDEAVIAELMACEKERAELTMIIDLERNDITKICEYGSIEVSSPRHVAAYPTVYHALAEISGKLRVQADGKGFCEILRAMFPGGSITGAPKVRVMEAIEKYEPVRRGVYTGSMGYIGIDGNVCLNIAIRTIIITGSQAFAQTGGGIVADSVAQREWEETFVKARALAAGIAAVNERS